MPPIKILLLLALVLLVLSGCGKKVEYLDSDIVQVDKTELDDNGEFAVAHLTFVHKSKGNLIDTVYRVEWLDKKGVIIETTSWRPLAVHGKRTISVTEKATVHGAVDFRIFISNVQR